MFLTPELSLSPTSSPSLQLPPAVLEDLCRHREKTASFIKGEGMYQCQKAAKEWIHCSEGQGRWRNCSWMFPYPAQKELLLGGREGINSLWLLDSAECHTSVGFGCQQVGRGMASPLPLSSAGASVCSTEGEDTSRSALSLLPLCLVCSDTWAFSASAQHAATICSTDGRCRGEDFGQKPPFSFAVMASLLLSEIPLPSGTTAEPAFCCCPGI